MKKINIIGILLIIIGLIHILRIYFGLFLDLNWDHIWPFILVILGAYFVSKK